MFDKGKIEHDLLSLLNEIENSEIIKIEGVEGSVREIKETIETNEFRITVVGEFSSGKSTFLNAFIGKDILPSALSETTAAITYIHNISQESPMCNQVVVNLNNGERRQFDITNSEEFIQYSTTNTFSQKDVVKSVDSIDVYVPFAHTNERVVLIDTPGLNGMKQGHRDITLEEIESSHASICLFQIKGIGRTDVDFMKILMQHQEKFFFVINGIDMLKEDEGETPENKLKEFRMDIKQNFYDGNFEPELVYGISALKALVARDHSIKKLYYNDNEELTEDKRKICFEESGIKLLEDKLYGFLNSDELNKTFYSSLVEHLINLLEGLKESAEFDEKFHQAKVDDDPDKKRWEKLRNEVRPKMLDFRNKLQSKVQSKIEELENELQKLVCKDVLSKFELIRDSINNISDVDTMKEFVSSDKVNKEICAFDVSERSILKKAINNGIENIYNNIYAEINRRLPTFAITQDQRIFVHTDGLRFDETVTINSDRIQQKEKELSVAEQNVTTLASRIVTVKKVEVALDDASRELKLTEASSKMAIRNHGRRPDPIQRQVAKVKKKNIFSRFLGGIRNLFGGDYESTYTTYETETDYSNVWQWEREKEEIQKRYDSLIKQQEQKVQRLSTQLRGDSSEELNARLIIEKRKIERIKKEMDREREIQEEKIRNSKSQYMRETKARILEQVSELFKVDNPRGRLVLNYYAGIQNILNDITSDVVTNIEKTYDERVKDFEARIDCMIRKCQETNDTLIDAQEVERLRANIEKFNTWLNKLNILANELHSGLQRS